MGIMDLLGIMDLFGLMDLLSIMGIMGIMGIMDLMGIMDIMGIMGILDIMGIMAILDIMGIMELLGIMGMRMVYYTSSRVRANRHTANLPNNGRACIDKRIGWSGCSQKITFTEKLTKDPAGIVKFIVLRN
jgi:hypothetical protein